MKTITSPVKEFPGTVKLPDRLTMPQALGFERSISDAQNMIEDDVSQTELDSVMVGVICDCVEEWSLDNMGDLSPETFPATPRKASAELVSWIYGEIAKMYNPDVPNG